SKRMFTTLTRESVRFLRTGRGVRRSHVRTAARGRRGGQGARARGRGGQDGAHAVPARRRRRDPRDGRRRDHPRDRVHGVLPGEVAQRYPGPVDPLSVFSPATRAWFARTFDAPTPPQERGWPAIAARGNVLIQAPTGSGKTLTAFLYAIDRLHARPGQGLRVLYVSPLKALNYDIERNLRGPLAGLESTLRVAVRTGDTPAKERRELLKEPPDILITTPESLFLMLTSQARDILRSVDTLIVDEVHAIAGTKRGV